MANKIQIRRGLKSKLPTLSSGELAYTTDTRETFVGTGSGNVNMGGSHWYTGTAMSGTSTTTGYYSYSACPEVKLGDIYLNTTYGYVYECTTAGSGTTAKWTYKGSIRGATGAKGATGSTGATGAAGTRGSVWNSGTAMSGTSTTTGAYSYSGASNALVGDYYLNTTYGYVYRCTTAGSGTSAKWTYQGSIKGATGATGPAGADGASVESSETFLTILENIAQTINPVNKYDKYDICSGSINQDKYLLRSMDWEDGMHSNREFFNGMSCTVLCVKASNIPAGCTLGILSTNVNDITWNGVDAGQAHEIQTFKDLISSEAYYRGVEIDYIGKVSYGTWQTGTYQG